MERRKPFSQEEWEAYKKKFPKINHRKWNKNGTFNRNCSRNTRKCVQCGVDLKEDEVGNICRYCMEKNNKKKKPIYKDLDTGKIYYSYDELPNSIKSVFLKPK